METRRPARQKQAGYIAIDPRLKTVALYFVRNAVGVRLHRLDCQELWLASAMLLHIWRERPEHFPVHRLYVKVDKRLW